MIVAKLYIFLLKKQDNYLRRSYISIQLVFNVIQYVFLMSHIFNGISTSETTNFLRY